MHTCCWAVLVEGNGKERSRVETLVYLCNFQIKLPKFPLRISTVYDI